MNSLPLVYLAGPYTKGNQILNVRAQLLIFHRLMDDGIVMPYAPLTSVVSELVLPRPWQDWMNHSYAMLDRCDAMLRSPAEIPEQNYFQNESVGADLEEKFAAEHAIPVFFTREALYDWVRTSFNG